MAYVIAAPCIGTKDTACVDACPVDCIHPKKDEGDHGEAEQLFIDPVECIDCGACVPVCPVSAIYAGDDLPEKWASYQEKNAAHFGRKSFPHRTFQTRGPLLRVFVFRLGNDPSAGCGDRVAHMALPRGRPAR